MDVKLPRLGEGADSGVVVNVFVKEGDTVAKDQAILELENEKAVASIPSTAAGVVAKIHVKPGDKISVGQRLISLSGGEPASAAAPAAKRRRRAPANCLREPRTTNLTRRRTRQDSAVARVAAPVASPSVRKLARELGIDLSRVRGSEAGGRIGIGDIRAYIARLQKAADKPRPAAATAEPAKPAAEQIDFSQWGPVTKKPVTPLRQVIARRLSESWNTIPHVTQFDDADFTQLNALRKKFAAGLRKEGREAHAHAVRAQGAGGDAEETSDFQLQSRRGRQ